MERGRPKRLSAPSLLARAEYQATKGADLLFARLDALRTRQERAAELLARWSERIGAGEWSEQIAALVEAAEALERTTQRTTP